MGASRSEEARRSNRIARGGGDDDDGDEDDDGDDDWLRLMEDGWSAVVDANETCVLIGARCPLQDLPIYVCIIICCAELSHSLNLSDVEFQ